MKLLIWGKTYPELSFTYKETVCTGGCTEEGTPIRLYPVPLRYLPNYGRYSLYDWVEAPVEKNVRDSRPESYRVNGEVTVIGHVPTDPGWQNRRRIIFSDTSWHYDCLDQLKIEEERHKKSIGLIRVGAVEKVWIKCSRSHLDGDGLALKAM